MNERIALIYADADIYNVNCTKVVISADVEPYKVYIVTNERMKGQRRDNKWTHSCSFSELEPAENFARSISDNFQGAHYLGRGDF